jgi:hypothetical protein
VKRHDFGDEVATASGAGMDEDEVTFTIFPSAASGKPPMAAGSLEELISALIDAGIIEAPSGEAKR